jgi:hypothetical protein
VADDCQARIGGDPLMAFGSKSREITHLKRLVKSRTIQRDNARKLASIHRANLKRTSARNSGLLDLLTDTQRARDAAQNRAVEATRHAGLLGSEHEPLANRLDRMVRACTRLRAELAAQHRVNDRLSDQLMGAMGYTDTALIALGVAETDGRERAEVTP